MYAHSERRQKTSPPPSPVQQRRPAPPPPLPPPSALTAPPLPALFRPAAPPSPLPGRTPESAEPTGLPPGLEPGTALVRISAKSTGELTPEEADEYVRGMSHPKAETGYLIKESRPNRFTRKVNYSIGPSDGSGTTRSAAPGDFGWAVGDGSAGLRMWSERNNKPEARRARRVDTGENYLSADYRRINPLLAALAERYPQGEYTREGFRLPTEAEERQLLVRSWSAIALQRRYACTADVEGWDWAHLFGTFLLFQRLHQAWREFDAADVAEGVVWRGDSEALYSSFGGLLDPGRHLAGASGIPVDTPVVWPGILSTTFGDPKTHNFINGKKVVWRIRIPVGHPGRSLGANNKSEQEVTFPAGTVVHVEELIPRGSARFPQEAGDRADVVILAHID